MLVEEFHDRLRIEGLDENYASANVRRGSITALPYQDRTFDRILCLDVLEHLPYPEQRRALAELRRALSDTGELLVSVPNLAHLQSRINFLVLGRLIVTASESKHPGDRPIREYLELAATAGFDVVERSRHLSQRCRSSRIGYASLAGRARMGAPVAHAAGADSGLVLPQHSSASPADPRVSRQVPPAGA